MAPLIVAGLVALTLAAFWTAGSCGWVGYDDPSYVTSNPMVNLGLREAAFYWAFTAVHGANWHPLTSLSHMLDVSLFGLDAGPAHWVSILWHTLNTALVFLVWRRLSGALWPSAFVAALFALHPQRVESVVWISERKDVLSTALWLLTILAYARWIARPSRARYAAVAVGFALAFMAKPMAVTLPCTLLLLDYWPLGRWPARSWRALILEKVPLLALALVGSAITVYVQHDAGATEYGQNITGPMRVGNAFVAYARYLGKMLWPQSLSPIYPHPGWWPWPVLLGSVAFFCVASWLVWRERERRCWLLFGWCWYLGTLVPVIGLVQVGAQSMADRYTYVPLLGIYTVIAWAGAECLQRWPRARPLVAAAAALVLVGCFVRTVQQIRVWENGIALFTHARSVVGEHPIVFREMATALMIAKRPRAEIIEQYQRGRVLYPDYPFFLTEIALDAERTGRPDDAIRDLERVRDLIPKDSGSYHNLGNVLMKSGRLADAERLLRQSLEIRSGSAVTWRILADVYVRQGRLADSAAALRAAIDADRWDWKAFNALGIVEVKMSRYSDAIANLEHALWINPSDKVVVENLAALRKQLGR